MFRNTLFTIITAVVLMTGCAYHKEVPSASAGSDAVSSEGSQASDPAEDTVEFHGITKKRSELSDDTLKWLDWYHSLPQEQQAALNFVPSEFFPDAGSDSPLAILEADDEIPAYLASLTEEELQETSELARYYFTELSPEFDGVEQIQPAEDTYPLYQNVGIENEYTPGNIIIYLVETGKDKKEGNPMRSISIARRSKSDEWKVINSGF